MSGPVVTQAAPLLPAVEYGQRTDPGRDPEKQVNEDASGRRETTLGHLCIVCDGMGGHAAGREAAELALATVFEIFATAPDDTSPADVLRAALEEANRRVHVLRTSEIGFGRPGSTAVAVLLHAHGTEVAHVGDSRAYLVHEGQIFRLTRDHSIVQELVERGLLTPQQATHHPDANRITRALGISPDVEVELRPQPVRHVAGDAFVLCSDGLSDLVDDHEILTIVGDEPAAQAVGKLVDLANARGGHDNITVLVLRARESAAAMMAAVPPTMAQTTVTQNLAAASPLPSAPAPNPPRTLVEIEPTAPGPGAPRAMAVATTATGIRVSPALLVSALVLAALATALLGGVLFLHFTELRGKRNSHGESLSVASDRDAGAAPVVSAAGAPTTLAPERVVIPAPSVPAGEPLAPLEPTTTVDAKKARK